MVGCIICGNRAVTSCDQCGEWICDACNVEDDYHDMTCCVTCAKDATHCDKCSVGDPH